MNTRFTSFVSGFAMSLMLVTPVLAETPVNVNDRAHILRCSEQSVGNYRVFLQESLEDMRSAIRSQWRRQADFRIRAAAVNRRTSVTSALRVAETQLETALTQFVTTQQNGINTDVNATVDIFARQNETQEEAGLEQWTNRSVSFQALDAALARSERTLRTYASTRDRAIITRVWNDTRRQVENAFSQAREETRGVFVEDMNSCIYGEIADVEQDDAQTTISDNNEPLSNNAATTPAFVVNDIKVDAVYGALSACSQRITFRSQIQGNHRGEMRGYFLYSDGQRSENMTGVTNATGFVALQHSRSLTAADNSPLNIRAKFIVTSPNQIESSDFSVRVACEANSINNYQPQGRADARVIIQGPSTTRTCGAHLFSFQGILTVSGPATVNYYWLRSDNTRTPNYTLYFDGPATKVINYDWLASGNLDGFVQLVVTNPNDASSPPARFSLLQSVPCAVNERAANNNTNVNTNNEVPRAENRSMGLAEASVTIQGPSTVTTCGTYPFSFRGTIAYNTAGTVRYHWLRSDGQISPTRELSFNGAGAQVVEYEWPYTVTVQNANPSVQLVVTSPNQTNAAAYFVVNRAPACSGNSGSNTSSNNTGAENTNTSAPTPIVTAVTAVVESQPNVTVCGPANFRFKGTVSVDRVTEVSYKWEHSDGLSSPIRTLSFDTPGSRIITEDLTTEARNISGFARLRVITPANIVSENASFTLTQSCS